MSTKDRTREQLLNSMRKTKKVTDNQADAKQAHEETTAPSAPKTTKNPTPAKIEKLNKIASTQPNSASDPYQSRGRVWPD